MDKFKKYADWLHLALPPKIENAPLMGRFLGFLITACLILLALAIPLLTIFFTVASFSALYAYAQGQSVDTRAIPVFIAFVVGLPLVIWRARIADRQADAALKTAENAANQIEVTKDQAKAALADS